MNVYGLIGYPLTHSFSKKYFTDKFSREGIADSGYDLFELPDIGDFPQLLATQPNIRGLNVTIPHKQAVIPYLDRLDESARKVGAVNVIKLGPVGETTGYNSDYYGFRQSLSEWLAGQPLPPALVLGNGGAAKAVAAVLTDLAVSFVVVSRQTAEGNLRYEQLDAEVMARHRLIINTTPLGTYPSIEAYPAIPYQWLTSQHWLYDLVYNPAETAFMRKGLERGARVHNGLHMLQLQAEKAWEIWNTPS